MSDNNKMAVYADRDQVIELAKRCQSTLPGGKNLSLIEATGLAQLALAHGLDPWNGEIWHIPGSGVMVGIKGLRKSAKVEAKKEGDSIFWIEHIRVKAEKYEAKPQDVVYECHLRDTYTTQAWASTLNTMVTAGMPYAEAKQALGPAPEAVGVGIASPEEKSKMGIHQRARKRAEADSLKQRYGVEFVGAEFDAEGPEEIQEDPDLVEGQFVEPEAEPRDEATILTELGYDVPEQEPKVNTDQPQPKMEL